jgi:hypothetical protein
VPKHGIIGLTKVVALETATTEITCNAICPGWVLTPLVQKQIDALAARQSLAPDAARVELLGAMQPSLEFATPDEIGATALFLCSQAAREIRGGLADRGIAPAGRRRLARRQGDRQHEVQRLRPQLCAASASTQGCSCGRTNEAASHASGPWAQARGLQEPGNAAADNNEARGIAGRQLHERVLDERVLRPMSIVQMRMARQSMRSQITTKIARPIKTPRKK